MLSDHIFLPNLLLPTSTECLGPLYRPAGFRRCTPKATGARTGDACNGRLSDTVQFTDTIQLETASTREHGFESQ